jgi:hypothetical protein
LEKTCQLEPGVWEIFKAAVEAPSSKNSRIRNKMAGHFSGKIKQIAQFLWAHLVLKARDCCKNVRGYAVYT